MTFLNLQSLASAIAATKVLSAQQVVKNEAGEEVSSGVRAHILIVLKTVYGLSIHGKNCWCKFELLSSENFRF